MVRHRPALSLQPPAIDRNDGSPDGGAGHARDDLAEIFEIARRIVGTAACRGQHHRRVHAPQPCAQFGKGCRIVVQEAADGLGCFAGFRRHQAHDQRSARPCDAPRHHDGAIHRIGLGLRQGTPHIGIEIGRIDLGQPAQQADRLGARAPEGRGPDWKWRRPPRSRSSCPARLPWRRSRIRWARTAHSPWAAPVPTSGRGPAGSAPCAASTSSMSRVGCSSPSSARAARRTAWWPTQAPEP